MKKALEAYHGEAVIISKPADIFYLCGLNASAGKLLLFDSSAYLFVDTRYFEAAQACVNNAELLRVEKDYIENVLDFLLKNGVKSCAFVKSGIELIEYVSYKEKAALLGIECSPAEDKISGFRSLKDKSEIETMKANILIAEKAYTKLLALVKEGMSERELAAEFEYLMKYEGADENSFKTIVLFGERSSMPHGEPSERKLKYGDNVLVDFGIRKGGYCSDTTRCFFFGKGEGFDEKQKIYEAVQKAHKAAADRVGIGVMYKDCEDEARSVLEAEGLNKSFVHSLGHGVGLEIHELPFCKNGIPLERSNIITIEPGVYIPGKMGVRLENEYIVSRNGAVPLNNTPLDLIVL